MKIKRIILSLVALFVTVSLVFLWVASIELMLGHTQDWGLMLIIPLPVYIALFLVFYFLTFSDA